MAKKVALLFGIVFLIVGVLGFVPNPIVGMDGIFETDMMHNVVHILFGVLLLISAKIGGASLWLKILGVVYLILAVLGFLMAPDSGMLLGLVHVNAADHWLHLVLGVVLLGAAFMGKKKAMSAQTMM